MKRKTVLADKLEELLNLHPYLRFRVLDHVADLDDFYGNMINDFAGESPHFWGLLTDYIGEYIPIPNANSTIESCIVYLHVPIKFVDEAFNYLKTDFAEEIVAKSFTDGEKKTIMTMNIPEIIETSTKDGIDYAIIRIMFSFKASANYVFGNDVKIKINGVDITPFDGRQIDQLKDNEEVSYIGIKDKTSRALANIIKHSHIFYYENREPFNDLLSELIEGNQNIIYDLEYTLPNGIVKSFDVVLESGTYLFPLGQFIILNCVFASAEEA